MIVEFLFGYGGSKYVPSTPAMVPAPVTTPINRRRLFRLRRLPSRPLSESSLFHLLVIFRPGVSFSNLLSSITLPMPAIRWAMSDVFLCDRPLGIFLVNIDQVRQGFAWHETRPKWAKCSSTPHDCMTINCKESPHESSCTRLKAR